MIRTGFGNWSIIQCINSLSGWLTKTNVRRRDDDVVVVVVVVVRVTSVSFWRIVSSLSLYWYLEIGSLLTLFICGLWIHTSDIVTRSKVAIDVLCFGLNDAKDSKIQFPWRTDMRTDEDSFLFQSDESRKSQIKQEKNDTHDIDSKHWHHFFIVKRVCSIQLFMYKYYILKFFVSVVYFNWSHQIFSTHVTLDKTAPNKRWRKRFSFTRSHSQPLKFQYLKDSCMCVYIQWCTTRQKQDESHKILWQ